MNHEIQIKITLQRKAFNIDLSLDLPSRGVSAIFGPSGCGKSSLLRCLAGLEPDCRGFISVNNEVWQDDSKNIFLRPSDRPAALAFQNGALFPHMSVLANLEYGLRRKGRLRKSLGADDVIQLLDLSQLLTRRPSELSGGERQRVAIGRTLLAHPSLLLLDEPMSGLDFKRKSEILPFLERLHQTLDIPIVYVSHMPGEVMRLADHLTLMHQGHVRASGAINEVLFDESTPLSLQNSAAIFLTGKVLNFDTKTHLARINTTIGEFSIPSEEVNSAQDISLRIPANSVQPSSAENGISATVSAVSTQTNGRVLIRYSVNNQTLFGRSAIADLPSYPLTVGTQIKITIAEPMLDLITANAQGMH